jgi:ubiquinone/menaquinone biosynthesis C-methylase UbiE
MVMTDLVDADADRALAADADRALKAKHRAMWAMGDFPAVATEVIPQLGPVLVEAAGIKAGDQVLDVGAGSGNASIPAAQLGAKVVASDLTPELLETGQREAEARGLDLEWRQADAEALPFDDASFDVVISCLGVMFAPHHQPAADELVRVCRPEGTISVLSWTPEGFLGDMFSVMKPYAPPPPPGAQPAMQWGNEAHVRGLFGDRVTDIEARRENLRVEAFDTPEAFRDFFKATYGPTIAVYNNIADDPEKVAELDAALAELGRRYDHGSSRTVMDWEYLIFTARKTS